MATTIKDTDLWLVSRNETNYSHLASDFKDFVAPFPANTRMLFNQVNAPLGWINLADSNTNNTALRIVKSGGGSVGNGTLFTSVFKSHSIKAAKHKHALNENNHSHTATIANHSHGVNDPGHTHSGTRSLHGHTTPTTPKPAFGDSNAKTACRGNTGGVPNPHRTNPAYGEGTGGAAAAANVSVNSSGNLSYSSGNNGALGISISNAGSSVTWDFSLKYNDFIICKKDNY